MIKKPFITARMELELLADIEKYKLRLRDAIEQAVYELAAEILKNCDVPVDIGALELSGRLESGREQSVRQVVGPNEKPIIDPKGVEVSIVFGGDGENRAGVPVSEYAQYVHERLDVTHDTGRAKFLESAVHDMSGAFKQRLELRIKELMKAGGGHNV